jgi:Hemerythrin HHE cation binding domain
MKNQSKPSAKQVVKKSDSKIKHLTRELTREDLKLGMPLLDAAVAGAILGFRPTDAEMRRQAELAWETIRPQLSQHLLSEEDTLLPWAEGSKRFSAQAVKRIKARHHELKSLARNLNDVSFEEDKDEVVAPAGRALCMLAVKLDDLIDSEEMRLLPALRKALFG